MDNDTIENSEITTADAGSVGGKKRGPKKGSKVKCSHCGEEGHNRTSCPQKAQSHVDDIAQLKQALARVREENRALREEKEMHEHGREHVIYGIYNREKDYACLSDPVYVGKSYNFKGRASSHKSAKGVIRKMSRNGLRGVIVPLRTERFKDEAKGKKWVDRWESYYMMKYECHKYNPNSCNTNWVGDGDELMKVIRKKKEALECLPMDDILRDEEVAQEWSRVLGNYEKYVQADQEAKKQSSSSSEDGD